MNNDEPEQPGGGCAKGGGESVGRDGGENGDSNRGAAADGEAVCIQAAFRVRPRLPLPVTSAGAAAAGRAAQESGSVQGPDTWPILGFACHV